MDYFSDYYIDKIVADKYGKSKKDKIWDNDIVNTFGKSLPDTAYKTVHRFYAKKQECLKDTKYLKCE